MIAALGLTALVAFGLAASVASSAPEDAASMLQFQLGGMKRQRNIDRDLVDPQLAEESRWDKAFIIEVGGKRRTSYTENGDKHPDLVGRTVHVWPEALLPYRCTSDHEASCAPCTGGSGEGKKGKWISDKDCWIGGGAGRDQTTKGAMSLHVRNMTYRRHLAKFELKCATDGFLRVGIKKQIKGTFSIWLNGVQELVTTSASNKVVEMIKLPKTKYQDMHTISLEFKPHAADAKIALRDVLIVIDEKFAQCEESQMCLDKMVPGGIVPEHGIKLRNDLSLQLKCLNLGEAAVANFRDSLWHSCKAWRECVELQGKKDDLLAILRAATNTLDTTSSWATNARQQALQQELSRTALLQQSQQLASKMQINEATTTFNTLTSSTKTCKMPPNMDAESWQCNCYESMKTKCDAVALHDDYNQTLCFQALMCSGNVCAEWKDYNCPDPDDPSPPWPLHIVKAFQQELSHTALLQQFEHRASKMQINEDVALDNTLDNAWSSKCI